MKITQKLIHFGQFIGMSSLLVLTATGATISKLSNNNNLDLGTSWNGGVAPSSSDIAQWSGISGTTTAIGSGLTVTGLIVGNTSGNTLINAGTGPLSIGSSGIDMANATRNFTVAAPTTLAESQTFNTASGTVLSFTGAVTANTLILTKSGAGTLNFASGSNSFTSTTLNLAGGRLTTSNATAFGAGTTLNINGSGSTLASVSGDANFVALNINADFNLSDTTNNARLRLNVTGGAIDLGGATRIITIGRYNQVGNQNSGLATNTATVQLNNGHLALAAGADATPSNLAGFYFGPTVLFNNNADLTIGANVRTAIQNSNSLGNSDATRPDVTVSSGGIFNLSVNDTNIRSQTIASLSGAGQVIAGTGATVTPVTGGISTLTINGNIGSNVTSNATFSGTIADGDTAVVKVAVVKSGTERQIFSGTNTYTGTTTISGGVLQFGKPESLYNANNASWTTSNIIVNSGATLAFQVGGSGEFSESQVASLLALGSGSGGFKTGSRVGFDTSNAGGEFTYGSVIANPNTNANTLGLRKLGSGKLTLSQVNTYTGGTIIEQGTLATTQAGGIGTTGTLAISAGATYETRAIATSQHQLATTGTGTIQVYPASSATATQYSFTSGSLTGYTGSIVINPSTSYPNNSRVDFNGVFGSGCNISILSGATARLVYTGTFSNLNIVAQGSGGSGPGALRLESNKLDSTCSVTLAGHTSIGGFTTTSTISCPITDGGNGYTLSKVGSSTLVLEGVNTYGGDTNVNSGTLSLKKASLADNKTLRIYSGAIVNLNYDESGGEVTDTVGTLIINGQTMPSGTYGATGSGATTINDTYFTGNGTITVPSSGDNYDTWASANGITGQSSTADADGDGLSNLVEYGLGLNPTQANASPGTFNGSTLTFNKGATALSNQDLTYIIETSADLATWTTAVTHAPGNSSSTISYTLPNGEAKTFARLKITKP